MSLITFWDHDYFPARGMRRMYGRGDAFGVVSCEMDMWVAKDGKVWVRFWSSREALEPVSYEVRGLSLAFPPNGSRMLDEDCVPDMLRSVYDEWVAESLDYRWG